MALRRRPGEGGSGVARSAATADSSAQQSAGLAKLRERLTKLSHPQVLDLGPMCGQSIVRLAERGARVFVEAFEAPPPTPPRKPGEPPPDLHPLRIDQPDAKFDAVLAWEQIDFVPGDRLAEFGSELRRVLKEGGWLLLYSHMKPGAQAGPPHRFRVLSDDRVSREPSDEPSRRRYTHSTRDIERCLQGFSIHGLHLGRNQVREFTAVRAAQAVKDGKK